MQRREQSFAMEQILGEKTTVTKRRKMHLVWTKMSDNNDTSVTAVEERNKKRVKEEKRNITCKTEEIV